MYTYSNLTFGNGQINRRFSFSSLKVPTLFFMCGALKTTRWLLYLPLLLIQQRLQFGCSLLRELARFTKNHNIALCDTSSTTGALDLRIQTPISCFTSKEIHIPRGRKSVGTKSLPMKTAQAENKCRWCIIS